MIENVMTVSNIIDIDIEEKKEKEEKQKKDKEDNENSQAYLMMYAMVSIENIY